MRGARDNLVARNTGQKPGATARKLARAWRELTGGTGRDRDSARRTLIACSGGGDSSGLVLALSAAVGRAKEVFVVGHVVHDLRGRAEALADRDAVRGLAERVRLEFVEGEVKVRAAGGNAEGAARRLRYAELARMARESGCGYIATAHHAEDQLETMLMALVRGAGVRGLAGIAERRRVEAGGGLTVIRPALGVSRRDLQSVCEDAGWEWREDLTNLDESRLRAAIRARVVPELERLRPGAAKRAARAAGVVRGAARVVAAEAAALMAAGGEGETASWERSKLRSRPEVVRGELVRLAARRLAAGQKMDRLSASAVGRVARAMGDREVRPREFSVGAIVVGVTSKRVTIRKVTDGR